MSEQAYYNRCIHSRPQQASLQGLLCKQCLLLLRQLAVFDLRKLNMFSRAYNPSEQERKPGQGARILFVFSST